MFLDILTLIVIILIIAFKLSLVIGWIGGLWHVGTKVYQWLKK